MQEQETFKDRLDNEQRELNIRLDKLNKFIQTPDFREKVSDGRQCKLLLMQADAMYSYNEILKERIALLEE